MAIDWAELRNRPLTRDEKRAVREFYRGDYHERSDYTARHPWHREIMAYRVAITRAVFPDVGRVLDAGCAAGELVHAFREQGTEAFGFDVCPDLPDMAYPEARGYLRMGRVDHMPFSKSDALDTLVSFDVFEHVPVDCLERMPGELARLGIHQISCVIAADTISEGHITIQPTEWWHALFANAGFRPVEGIDDALRDVLVPAGWNDAEGRAVYAPYDRTGTPRNGWNRVPGHLFYSR